MDSNGRMKEFERKIKCKKFMFCYVKVFYVIVAYADISEVWNIILNSLISRPICVSDWHLNIIRWSKLHEIFSFLTKMR